MQMYLLGLRNPDSKRTACGRRCLLGESLGLLRFHDDTAAPGPPGIAFGARCAASSLDPPGPPCPVEGGAAPEEGRRLPEGGVAPLPPPRGSPKEAAAQPPQLPPTVGGNQALRRAERRLKAPLRISRSENLTSMIGIRHVFVATYVTSDLIPTHRFW